VGVILLWVCVFPRESQNPILVAQGAGPVTNHYGL
jgi:hypothetical protein